ncbi:MAG: SDR family NAD(P)-dependent oxidoreductase [Pseudomonadota bacterium]
MSDSSPPTSARAALQGLHFFASNAYSFSALGYRQRRLLFKPVGNAFEGQRWLVSGASGGIGRAIALGAARRGADVLGVARSADKLSALAGEHDGVDVHRTDLSLKAEIGSLVEALSAPIDVLVNNVGVLLNRWSRTGEGHETSFATNLLGHFALTEALLERGVLSDDAVVINMTSGGMYNVPLSIEQLDGQDASAHDGVMAYAYQKRAQVVLNQWWRQRHAARALDFYVMHPGWADTEGVRTSLPGFRALFSAVLRDADAGADTALWLAATRPPQRDDGAVWFDRKARPAHSGRATRRSADDGDALVAFLNDSLVS